MIKVADDILEEGVMDPHEIKHLRQALRYLEMKVGSQLREDRMCFGITIAQCHALIGIGDKQEVSIVDLAASLGLDTSTLSRTIDGMVNIGLVDRRQNTHDRRYVSISLTKQGKALYKLIEGFYLDYFSRLFTFIPKDKHKQLVESFCLFADAIKKSKEKQGCCENSDNAKSKKREGENE